MGKASRKKRRRIIPIPPELNEAFRELRLTFREKFGRDPGPDDPVFFDPDSDTPKPYPEQKAMDQITAAMMMAGIDPAKIYATRKTGMFPTEENLHLWSKADLAEWRAAIQEYEGSQVQ